MERFASFLKVILLLLIIFLLVFVFLDDILSVLSIVQNCSTPLCRNNAQLFRDVCANCRIAFENANETIDRIRDFFRR